MNEDGYSKNAVKNMKCYKFIDHMSCTSKIGCPE